MSVLPGPFHPLDISISAKLSFKPFLLTRSIRHIYANLGKISHHTPSMYIGDISVRFVVIVLNLILNYPVIQDLLCKFLRVSPSWTELQSKLIDRKQFLM